MDAQRRWIGYDTFKLIVALILLAIFILLMLQGNTPVPPPVPSDTPTATPSVTSTPSATPSPSPTPSLTPSPSPKPTATATRSPTPTLTIAPSFTPTPTPTITQKPPQSATVVITRSVTVIHVRKGGIVIAEVFGMPAHTDFTITVGKAGSGGLGGYQVAHLYTGDTDYEVFIAHFEIPVLLRDEDSLDLRLDSPGSVYVVNFKNVDF